MASVDVGAETYTNIYSDLDSADLYMEAAIHGDSWRAADDDTKGRALVTATRTLDRQIWADAYNTYTLRVAVPAIVAACVELALALIDGSEVQNNQNTAEKIRSMSAGSVNIAFARGTDIPTRFPQIVQELLNPYLGGGSGSASLVAQVNGVSAETMYPIDLGFNGGLS